MLKKNVVLFIIAWVFLTGYAQENFTLRGKVYDFKTRTDLPGATVQLLRADSTLVGATTAVSSWRNGDQTGETSDYSFKVPKQESTYIIRCSFTGYKTTDITVILGNLKKREFLRELPPILLQEDSKMLNEITVSATKVQFYYRGDTVVYNANAFVLADGSMLDALVRQLPGVEIRENGDIYHDGKLVKNLMLNGKDFFKNNMKIMLDNLPTYMVKQIEVYDRLGERSRFVEHELLDDKEYVMDVKLKKEYSVRWMANAEVGMGVADKNYTGDNPYLARLFAMRFTDHSQLALYANANDLSDQRKPGQKDGFKPENLGTGTLTQQLAGVTYGIDARSKQWKLGGDVNVSNAGLRREETTHRTNFLASGDTYDRMVQSSHDKNLTLSSNHELQYRFKQVMLNLQHSLLYRHFDSTSSMESETKSDTLLNRYYTYGLTRGHELKTGFAVGSVIKFRNNTTDYVDAKASVLYNHRKDDTFKRYNLYLGSTTQSEQTADQYYRNHPDRSYVLDASFTYNHQISPSLFLDIKYGVKHTASDRDSRLYRLDLLTGYEQGDMGLLPSVAEYTSVQDLNNSFDSHTTQTDNQLIPGIQFYLATANGGWTGQMTMPLTLRRDRLDYQRGNVDTTLTRTSFLIQFHNTSLSWTSKDNARKFGIIYKLTPRTPDLQNMVNVHDDTDPLNIHEGNAALNNSYNHQMNVSYSFTVKRAYNNTLSFDAEVTDNAIAMDYTYNPATGVRTYRARNVNGNWNMTLRDGFKFRHNRISFSSMLHTSHVQNVDFIGLTSDNISRRSIVRSDGLGVQLNPSYTWNKHTLGIKMDGDWKYISSSRDDFTNQNVWSYDYGIIATFQILRHLQLSTDVTMFSRRGYHDASLNTNDLVWNARLSYTVLKGNLLFMLDGFDILGQLSNITYTLNGQARTEIRRNVLPQYVLFHVQYRLNKRPK